MSYFVTGATGFIGRHLVERLLDRDGDIYVLVREGSTDKFERLLDKWGRPERVKPVFGDLSQPQLGIDDAAREQLAGRRPLLPPRRGLRHHGGRDDQRAPERRRHPERDRPRERARGQALPPHVLDRGRRQLRRLVHRGRLRRGPGVPQPVPPDEVRVREARARARAGAVARVPPVARRRQLEDRRDGQDRRAVLLLQGDPEAPARAAGVVPADLARVRAHQRRAGRLRRRRRRPHRPPGRARQPGVPRRRPEAAALG